VGPWVRVPPTLRGVTDTTTTGAGPGPAPDDVVLGRYRLVDRVSDAAGSTLWRGYDTRLARPVSVRFMPLDHPTMPRLRDASVLASRVTDRRVVPILDIVEDAGCGRLVIVTEWITGTPLGQLLTTRGGEPLPPREAATLALEVARFLGVAHAAGVTHGHLRPNAVTIADTGEVRVRGLGVDQALYGVEPDIEPHLADVHGAGAVLFAGLTGRWPGGAGGGQLAGVPTLSGGHTPWPSRVVADVPADLDEVAARALQSTQPPKGRPHLTDVGEVVDALTAALAVPQQDVSVHRPRSRLALRTAGVLVAVLAAVGVAGLGVRLVLGLGGTPLTVPRTSVQPPAGLAPTAVAVTPATTVERLLPVVSARDYDPYGNHAENLQAVGLAIDGDATTAWTTARYRTATMSGKPGVGLVLDLGVDRPVDAVDLRLVGNGTDLTLYATDDPTKPLKSFTRMAGVTGAGNVLTLRVPNPVTTRYLVVWFTHLPPADTAFQGGVADVRVLG
jgi:hypothetical protein